MRKLLTACLAFAAGAALGVYVLSPPWLFLAGALALLPGVLPGRKSWPRRWRARCRLLSLGLAAGFLWTGIYDLAFVRPAERWDGVEVSISGRAVAYSEHGADYDSVVLRLTGEDGPKGLVRVYAYGAPLPETAPGDILEGTVTLRYAGTRHEEATEFHLSDGVTLLAYPEEGLSRAGRWEHAWVYFPKVLAARLAGTVAALWPEDAAPLVQGILLGVRGDLDADIAATDALGVSGIYHVVSVSGFHVSVLAGMLGLLVQDERRRALLGLPLVGLFTLLTGAEAPVLRAAFMQAVLLLAPLARREEDSLTSLGAALALLLAHNPHAVADVSLQLSFAATAGILLLARPITGWLLAPARRRGLTRRRFLGPVLRDTAGVLGVSAGVHLLSAPLLAFYFGYLSLYSALTNLACLWLVSVVFVSGWAILALGLVLPGAAAALAWAAAWPLRGILFLAEGIARLPYAALYMSNPWILAWMLLFYAMLAVALLTAGRRGFRPWTPCGLGVITLCAALLFTGSGYLGESVNVLDVGQGQCVVLTTGRDAVVVDCGGMGGEENAGAACASFLGGRGVREISALVLTHLHADHCNGVERLLARMRVAQLYLPADADDSDGMLRRILAAAVDQDTEVVYLGADAAFSLGELELTLFAPLGEGEANERGLLCLGRIGAFDFLITGDADAAVELALTRHTDLPKLELLVAGHHGSATSTGHALLSAGLPEAVAVSVGEHNSYGHPAEATLERLALYDVRLYRTDLSGDLFFPAGG